MNEIVWEEVWLMFITAGVLHLHVIYAWSSHTTGFVLQSSPNLITRDLAFFFLFNFCIFIFDGSHPGSTLD